MNTKKSLPAGRQGFTLSEVMLMVTIIAILAVMSLLTFQKQIIRGNDGKRKTDLAQLRVLFDDYYNDHNCYPQVATWNGYNCLDGSGGQFFAPYLQGQKIPCDPVTNERYLYITIPEDAPPNISACSGYKLFAALGNLQDPYIPGSGCSSNPLEGCGYEPYKYNYGISVGGTIANPVFDFSAPVPTPTPPGPPGDNFCLGDGSRVCNTKAGLRAPDYDNRPCGDVLRELGCTSFFDGALCSNKCQNEYTTYKCSQTEIVRCIE